MLTSSQMITPNVQAYAIIQPDDTSMLWSGSVITLQLSPDIMGLDDYIVLSLG
jgi:hypothetical protein